MGSTSIVPTENDIIFFGRRGMIAANAGMKRLREILKEKFETHRKADQLEQRGIEDAIMVQITKKDAPSSSNSRFLECAPTNTIRGGSFYYLMSNDQVHKALAELFTAMSDIQSDGKNMASKTKANSKTHDPSSAPQGSNEDIIGILKTKTPPAKETSITVTKRPDETTTMGSHKKHHASVPPIVPNYTANHIFLTDHDVVFSRTGPIGNTAGTNLVRKILEENMETYQNCTTHYDKGNLELTILRHVESVLPFGRFLRFVPTSATQLPSYRWMNQHETLQAIVESFSSMEYTPRPPKFHDVAYERHQRHNKEIVAAVSPEPAACILPRNDDSSTNSISRLITHESNRSGGQNNDGSSSEHPITGILNIQQQPLKGSNPSLQIQEPRAGAKHDDVRQPSCISTVHETDAIINETSTTATKRPNETTTMGSHNKQVHDVSLPVAPSCTTNVLPTENDVVFGKRGRRSLNGNDSTAGSKRLWEIVNKNHEFHRNADRPERRKIEKAVLEQLKKELAPNARFLRFVPASGSKKEFYLLMTDKEVRKAMTNIMHNAIRSAHKQKKMTPKHKQKRPPNSTKEKKKSPAKKRPTETTTSGSHKKKARVSLTNPPLESSGIETVGIEEDPAEPSKELESPSNSTTAGMESGEHANVSLEEENQELREENEQLLEEMEQLKMNHAEEIGFLQGGSGGDLLSEEVTKLKEELERARQRIKELEGRHQSESLVELKQEKVEVKEEELDTIRHC